MRLRGPADGVQIDMNCNDGRAIIAPTGLHVEALKLRVTTRKEAAVSH